MKRCSSCKISKPLEEFPRHPHKRDGRGSRCNECRRRDHALWRANNPDKKRAANQRYHQRLRHPEAIPPGYKICAYCNTLRPAPEFARNRSTLDGLSSKCKSCLTPNTGRDYSLKTRLGVTHRDYIIAAERQQHRCAICGKHEHDCPRQLLYFDHDHQSGTIRGLLCPSCNTAIGLLADDPNRITAAITYLTNAHRQTVDPSRQTPRRA